MLAALLLLASQFATVVSVDVAAGSCEGLNDTDPTLAERCVQGGFERHGPAFALLAAAVLGMALWGGPLPSAAAPSSSAPWPSESCCSATSPRRARPA